MNQNKYIYRLILNEPNFGQIKVYVERTCFLKSFI